MGSMIAIVPTYAYIKIAFRHGSVVLPQEALSNHKKAFMVRFGLNLFLFTLVGLFDKQCNFLVLFGVFFAVLSAYWLSLLIT
jgi:F0F1-type ATP synthase assembly protein I